MQLEFQKDPAIPVRIGIHIGDILISEEDIIGDGVNIASRIESLVVPGSVFISERVFDEIKNHPSIETAFLKTFNLKNVKKPMEVYAISNKGLIVPKIEDIKGKTEEELSSLSEKQKETKPRLKKGVSLGITITSIIALLIFLYFKFGANSSASSIIPERSIAVLAFENMSGDPEQDYFSDGISEEILNVLTTVEGLKVAGRTSAFSFKGKNEDIRSIGEKLNVAMVLEGSVRKAGNRVRITAQLINVEDGFHLWSETYDREMEDIFVIQDEISAKIVEKLKLQVQGSSEDAGGTQNIEAYDLLLKGVYFLNKDYEGTKKAMDCFQKAIELDPEYAEAYALIGDAYINYAAYGFLSSADAFSNARTAAQKAISLNERDPHAHKILAYVHFNYDWNWEAALSEYNKALQDGLDDPDHFITFYDIWLNKDYEHAIRVCEQKLEYDILQIESHWHLGFCNFFAGNFEQALKSFNNSLELDPNYSEGHRWKGSTLAQLGRFEEAIQSVERALVITQGSGPASFDLLRVKVLMGNNEEEVLVTIKEWEKSGENIDPMGSAILYAMLGMQDDAMVWLEKGYRQRSHMMTSLKALWVWDPYRADPRFIEIYDRMNFPE